MKLSPLGNLGVEIPFFCTPGFYMSITCRINIYKFYKKSNFGIFYITRAPTYGYLLHRYRNTRHRARSEFHQGA